MGTDIGKVIEERQKAVGGYSFNVIVPAHVPAEDLEEYIQASLSTSAQVVASAFVESAGLYEDKRRLIMSVEINVVLIDYIEDDPILDLFYEAEKNANEEDANSND